jgi:hypothetical protein
MTGEHSGANWSGYYQIPLPAFFSSMPPGRDRLGGFALPRPQSRTSLLIAALVIAFFWVPWYFFGWHGVEGLRPLRKARQPEAAAARR